MEPGGVVPEDNRLEGIKEAEVEAAVDEDADAADDEAAIKAPDAIWKNNR